MFEFVRQFRQWVMIGTVILVSFAFGITGVVYSVLTPNRSRGEKKVGSYTVSAVTDSGTKVTVKRKEYDEFERRWDTFLLDHLSGFDMLFGQAMKRGGRMYDMAVRMAMQRAIRSNPFFRFIPYVQSRYSVDLIRNLLFLRSGGSSLESSKVRMTPPLNKKDLKGLDQARKTQKRRRDWAKESVWRLRYMLDLAREAGFAATDQEIVDLVKPYLKRMNQRGKRRIEYQQFVENQANMSIDRFETTLKEMITILKFLGSVSRTSAVEGKEFLSNFQQDRGLGVLLVTGIKHENMKEKMYSNRKWRLRQRFMALHPSGSTVEALSAFSSDLGSGDNRQSPRGKNSGDKDGSLEKRQFGYLYIPLKPYLDSTDAPSEDRLRTYYENNKEREFSRNESNGQAGGTNASGTNGGSKEKGGDGSKQGQNEYVPFEKVRDQIKRKLHRKRALRSADGELKKLVNSTISKKEIRGEPVDFQRIANQADVRGSIEYRTSPLLDREDMTYYLKEKKGVETSHLEKLNQLVFERDLGSEKGAGPYLDEPIWFEDGVILPRLIRVESDPLVPSSSGSGRDSEGKQIDRTLSEFEEKYPIPSLHLKEVLRWRMLRSGAEERARQMQKRLVRQYELKRDELWGKNEVFGPPVPPRYSAEKPSNSTETKAKKGEKRNPDPDEGSSQWPPGSFSSESFSERIEFLRGKWKLARRAFTGVMREAGLEVQETDPFNLEEGPSDVELLSGVQNQLQGGRNRRRPSRSAEGADLFEGLTGSGDEKSQMAVLIKKLPKSTEDLKNHLDEQRRPTITSERSSYLKQNIVTFIEQANFSLSDSSRGSPGSKTKP